MSGYLIDALFYRVFAGVFRGDKHLLMGKIVFKIAI